MKLECPKCKSKYIEIICGKNKIDKCLCEKCNHCDNYKKFKAKN